MAIVPSNAKFLRATVGYFPEQKEKVRGQFCERLCPPVDSYQDEEAQHTLILFFYCYFLLLQQDGTELFNFVDGHLSWPDYLRNMAADGTWGDHIILHAAANCFKTCIHVISSLSHDLTIRPECDVGSSSQLVLGHLHEHHYVSLRPKPGRGRYVCETMPANQICLLSLQLTFTKIHHIHVP